METPERIWFLLSRNLSGEATTAETSELSQLLQQRPELMQQYDMLQHLWNVPATSTDEPEQSDKIRQILHLSAAEEETPVKPIRRRRTFYRWAAVFIGFSVLAAALLFTKNNPRFPGNEIVAPKGSKTRTILPDGSTVWLNAGSRIVYADFSGPVREITLEGEAFFDITHKKKQPFIVHAGNIDIKVLGTAFNVKSYPDDKTIETTLIRGLVQIQRRDGKENQALPFYLHPNQKITLPKNAIETTVTPKKVKALSAITLLDSTLKENERFETAWVYNRLEFRGDDFEQLARKLERWYNVRIHFEDEDVRRLVFNGSIENESIEQAFEALKAAALFNVSINQNDIFISSVQ